MDKEYRCAHAVNKIIDWNESNEKHVIELKKVMYEEAYLSMCIRSKTSNKEVVYFTVKRTGSLMVEIKVEKGVKEILGITYNQRVLTTNGWLRIECGYDEIEDLLSQLTQYAVKIKQAVQIY